MSAFDDLSDIGPQQLFAGFLARASEYRDAATIPRLLFLLATKTL